MIVHILLIGSPIVVQLQLPESSSFMNWSKIVRADGGVFSDQVHIPYDKILAIGAGEHAKIFVAPSTETRQ